MMNRLLFAIVMACGLATVTHAYTYTKFVSISLSTGTATGFNNSDVTQGGGHPQATLAVCRVTTASGEIGYRSDGTTPTPTTSGTYQLEPGDAFMLTTPQDVLNFKAIALTATTSLINCQIYG